MKGIQFQDNQGRDPIHVPPESSPFHPLIGASILLLHCIRNLESSFELASTALHPSDVQVLFRLFHTWGIFKFWMYYKSISHAEEDLI